MPKLLITVGCSGSGKSTYAKELVAQGWEEINRDYWRFKQYCNGVNDWSLYKFTKSNEDFVTFLCDHDWEYAVDRKLNVIVSNTNLNQKDHNYWKAKAGAAGYEFEVKYFPETLTTLLKRDAKRGSLAVGQDVLFKQWEKWLAITNARKYVPNEHKPKAIWVDLDGTVAKNVSRGHHEYEKVGEDKPRLDVIEMIKSWCTAGGMTPVFMSGRPDSCYEATKNWLLNYFEDVSYLYMRKVGDVRCDSIIKEEMFWDYLEPNWNVVAAIDDRPRITRKQKDIGIPLVINVSKTYEDF